VGDHLFEFVHILGNSFQGVQNLTLEINGQVIIADQERHFLQRIEKFIARLDFCFRIEDASSLIELIEYMTKL